MKAAFITAVVVASVIGLPTLAMADDAAPANPTEFWQQSAQAAALEIRAQDAAVQIDRYINDITAEIRWTAQLPWFASTIDQRRLDALRLLRQVPAITEVAEIDPNGREQIDVSRLAMDIIGGGTDLSKDAKFTAAETGKTYYSPIYFRRESEPYMTIAPAVTWAPLGVSAAEVNLKFLLDVVSGMNVGVEGEVYVVDSTGHLIAHPNIRLVLQNRDLSDLPYIKTALTDSTSVSTADVVTNFLGDRVMTAHANIPELGWTIFAEIPAGT